MESLYTKYRPQTFADVVGQKHVVTTLEHAVLEGRTSHAYLFCGPRGTGKTTMARLLAKALLCEQGAGHLPDGTCEECQQIAAGEHPDVYELDAASRTGVDNVREEIISRVSFAPARGAYKMYIIDEVHMLTTAAFNALLKTLEEPPSHVVFVLCTTDPQKIPETILSRVQRFDFHAISNADIQERLTYICEREGFTYDPEAIELVVRHARGGMRDAISELEQLSVSGGGTISVDVARDVLGEVSASTLERMSLAMANRDVPKLFAQVESLVEVGRDLLQFTRALAGRLRDVYVVAAIGANSGIVAAPDDELPAISKEARAFGSVDRVARALSLLSDASTEMRVAPNQRLVLEVALTKIARPQTELTLEALADRVSSLERQMVALTTPGARKSQEEPVGGARAEQPRKRGNASRGVSQATGNTRDGAASEHSEERAPERRTETSAAPATSAMPQQRGVHAERSGAAAQAVSAQPERPSVPVQAQGAPSQSVAPTPANTHQAPRPSATQPMQDGRGMSLQATQATTRGASQAPQAGAGQGYPQAARQEARRPVQSAASAQGAQSARPAPQASAPAAPASASVPAGVTDPGELQRRWKQVVDGLLAAHPQHGSLLMSSTAVADDGAHLTVSLPKGSMFACRMLERADVRANVDPMIAQVFGPRKTRFGEGLTASTAPAADVPREATAEPTRPAPTHQAAQTTNPNAAAALEPAASVPRTEKVAPAQNPAPSRSDAASAQVRSATGQPAAPTMSSEAPQRPVATQQTAPAQQPMQSVRQTPSTQPQQAPQTHATPWEPAPLGEDDVPYDDADFTPYEEDFVFDPMLAAQFAAPQAPAPQVRAPHSEPQQAPAFASSTPRRPLPQQEVPIVEAKPESTPQAQRYSDPASVPPWEPVPATEPTRPEPAQASTPEPLPEPAPTLEPASQPAPTPEPTPEPQQEPTPAPQPGTKAEQPAAKPRRKQRVAGIPADIISMMTEIFGEGVTYTAMPSEGEEAEENTLDDGATPYDEGESEFVDEPVDDADYEDED